MKIRWIMIRRWSIRIYRKRYIERSKQWLTVCMRSLSSNWLSSPEVLLRSMSAFFRKSSSNIIEIVRSFKCILWWVINKIKCQTTYCLFIHKQINRSNGVIIVWFWTTLRSTFRKLITGFASIWLRAVINIWIFCKRISNSLMNMIRFRWQRLIK